MYITNTDFKLEIKGLCMLDFKDTQSKYFVRKGIEIIIFICLQDFLNNKTAFI